MRYIDIDALLKIICLDPDGKEECAILARAHRNLATNFAHDRQGYIKRNGSAKWRALKVRLTDLLGKKCWYTEAEPTGGDLVVDHYRPKSSYWFLAFDEHNYRVACPYANTSHHNDEHGCAGGKDEHFPLLDPRNLARGRNKVKFERPVILDPCNEDDCNLVSFLPDGRPVIHPDFVNDPIKKKRVEESKILLNLDHPDFNSKREQLHDEITLDVSAYKELPESSATRQAIHDGLARKIKKNAPFSIAARQYLSAHKYLDWVADLLESTSA